jgi:hypothetical protein
MTSWIHTKQEQELLCNSMTQFNLTIVSKYFSLNTPRQNSSCIDVNKAFNNMYDNSGQKCRFKDVITKIWPQCEKLNTPIHQEYEPSLSAGVKIMCWHLTTDLNNGAVMEKFWCDLTGPYPLLRWELSIFNNYRQYGRPRNHKKAQCSQQLNLIWGTGFKLCSEECAPTY